MFNRKKTFKESPNWQNDRSVSSDAPKYVKAMDVSPEPQKTLVGQGKRLKRGAKAAHWDAVRVKLKIEFEKAEITSCEVCGSAFNLRFAHRLKRRFITTDEELRTVALLCETHDVKLEYSGHENLYKGITKIIENRSKN